jgi:hypothetical protein
MDTFVIAAKQLVRLARLSPDIPQPIKIEWINRATNQKLNRTTIDLIKRTLNQPLAFSRSVRQLHENSGVRLTFQTAFDLKAFANAFRCALDD